MLKFEESQRMKALPAQFFASLVGRVQERVKAGRDVINLGQGNPDLPTPGHIVESLRSAALDPLTHRYPPFRGLPDLKQAAADYYRREYGVEIQPETEVAILFGGKAGLVEVSEIYLNPGDVALVPDPGYPDYWSGIALAGGRMETMPLLAQNKFLPVLSDIPERTLAEAKLMFLNYPNNPTGAVANSEFFQQVVDVASRHGILVVHDFAYGAIGFDNHQPGSFLQIPGAKSVGIEIYTLSKTYNMAGWRIAFAVGHADVIQQINTLQDHYYCSVFPGIQRAAITALSANQSSVEALVRTYERRRDVFIQELQRQGFECPPPGGSFFVWVPIPKHESSKAFADRLLEQCDVAVAPGIGFGKHGEGYVRIGLLTDEERLQEAARRMGGLLR